MDSTAVGPAAMAEAESEAAVESALARYLCWWRLMVEAKARVLRAPSESTTEKALTSQYKLKRRKRVFSTSIRHVFEARLPLMRKLIPRSKRLNTLETTAAPTPTVFFTFKV